MAKWNLTTPVAGGDLLPDVAEARVFQVRVDFVRNEVGALIFYGREVNGRFEQSPINPPGGEQVIADLDQYADVQAAWNNFERKLFQRAAQENKLPPGQDV